MREAPGAGRQDPLTAPRLLELCGGDPRAITGHMVTEAAGRGRPDARSSCSPSWAAGWARASPPSPPCSTRRVVVVGGGVSEAGDLLLEPARDGLRPRICRPGRTGRTSTIVAAALGNDAGLIGAADLARRP